MLDKWSRGGLGCGVIHFPKMNNSGLTWRGSDTFEVYKSHKQMIREYIVWRKSPTNKA